MLIHDLILFANRFRSCDGHERHSSTSAGSQNTTGSSRSQRLNDVQSRIEGFEPCGSHACHEDEEQEQNEILEHGEVDKDAAADHTAECRPTQQTARSERGESQRENAIILDNGVKSIQNTDDIELKTVRDSKVDSSTSATSINNETLQRVSDPQVKNKHFAVTTSQSPTFEMWEPRNASGDRCAKFINVSFHRCQQVALLVDATCAFSDVAFIDCRFTRTTFLDVTLSNVTFNRVDFTDTTMYKLRLERVTLLRCAFRCDIWRHLRLRDVLLGKESFLCRPGSTRDHKLCLNSAFTKTQCYYNPNAELPAEIKCSSNRDGSWERDIHLIRDARRGNVLTSLTKHKSIMNRIMQYCHPSHDIHIYEYPNKSLLLAKVTSTTKYWVTDNNSVNGIKANHMTTYFGSLQSETPPVTTIPSNLPHRGIGGLTNLLLVNKTLSAKARRHLYKRTFHFQCSAEGAREFLLAHSERMKLIKQLVLYYHWEGDKVAVNTSINRWRHLLATIRHQFSFIPIIRIHIGQSFWQRSRWSSGVVYVLGSAYNPYPSSPLGDVYKIAAPDDRWRFYKDDFTHRTDGTVLQIHIEGAETKEQIEFVKKITDEIEKRRAGRPLFALYEGKEVTYRCVCDL